MSDEARLRQLEAEVLRLRDMMYQRPIIVPASTSVVKKLKIIDGQTLITFGATTYYGVKRHTAQITEVPSAYDPNAYASTAGLFTATDGIGRAFLYINSVLQTSMVLVVHDTLSLHTSALAQTDYPIAANLVSIPVTGGGGTTVSAYRIDWP